MVGNRFNRLLVMGPGKSNGKNRWWKCRCDCGKETEALAHHLRKGHVQSCGCLQLEFRTKLEQLRDEERRKPTRGSYEAMLERCYNPQAQSYPRYGGAGRFVCDRWRFGEAGLSGWECFYADMGPRPEGTTLDRSNNDDTEYAPGKCRWATREEQTANRPKKYRQRSTH